MYLGRVQQGQELPLTLQCVDATGSPAVPTSQPAAAVYRDGSPPTLVEVAAVPAADQGVKAGFFRLGLFLGAGYDAAGRYLVVFRYLDAGGVARTERAAFTLLPGGSADGAVVSLYYAERPNARYLVYQTDAGKLVRGKNPR